jgi:hypothetical protein
MARIPSVDEPKSPLASVDTVREELRRLGYLDSGLDRFVLGGGGSGSTLAASWRASLRVGAVGGIVLGVALSLLAMSLEPSGLSPTDLALLALYLSLLLAAVTSLAMLLLGLGAASLAHVIGRAYGRHLPRLTGLALGGGSLLYLGLWWRSHGSEAPALQQLALVAIGAAVAFLLGRFGALLTVSVLSAGGLLDRVPEAALSRRHLLPLLLGATLVFGSSLAMANYIETRAEQPPDFAVVPSGARVRVIGIDGLEQRMVEQSVERGEMPRLAALLDKGARAALLPEPEQVPAIVWTTIATGRGPEAHGIRATGAQRLPGMTAPVPLQARSRWARGLARAADVVRITRTDPPSALLRGAKTIWNVASEKGLSVGVVNWWASWPAEAVNGFVVSDRTFLKLEKGGALEREVHPPDAFPRLQPLLTAAGTEDRAHRLDRFHAAALRALRQGRTADLEAVYLNGLDVFTMQRLDPAAQDLASLDARLSEVRAYHRFLDERLAEITADLAPDDVLIVVGDPGRFARRSSRDAAGLLLLVGAPIRTGTLDPASERDIAPTVLHLLGLPVSRELSGRVLEEALDPGFLAAHRVRTVASYGRRPRAGPAGSPFDRDVMEELRSLGYIR